MSSGQWFLIRDGKRTGPLAFEPLVAELLALEEPELAMVWRPGLEGWREAGRMEELVVRLPPPMPSGEHVEGPKRVLSPGRRPEQVDRPRTVRELSQEGMAGGVASAQRQAMLRQAKARRNTLSFVWGVPGLLLQGFGSMGADPIWALLFVAGTALLIIGLGYYAYSKGRSPAWGLFGLASCIGLLVLAALEDRLVAEIGGAQPAPAPTTAAAPITASAPSRAQVTERSPTADRTTRSTAVGSSNPRLRDVDDDAVEITALAIGFLGLVVFVALVVAFMK